MLRVAIVGCGKIADAHASQIRRIPECDIVGVCDTEPLMARQLFERFPVALLVLVPSNPSSPSRPSRPSRP